MKKLFRALAFGLMFLAIAPLAVALTAPQGVILFAAGMLGIGSTQITGGSTGACLSVGKNNALSQTTCNQPGLSGNGLVNFANPQLTTNGHKQILVVGNSTVWNATGYFAELCNQINPPTAGTGNVLASLGLTPCATTVSGYQALDSAGNIQVTFTGSTPSGYNVGDMILSQPTNGTLNSMIGTGVITAVGGSTINYRLISYAALPSAGAFTSSGGYVTNSLANLGQNGATAPAIQSAVAPLLATYGHAGDLVLVRGPIINDVRLGACNLACATANVSALYNGIISAVPALTDIAWKTENSLLTTDPGSTGYVSPLGSSAAYSKILHDAVFAAFSTLPSRAAVWDNMQIVYTKLGGEYATSAWMTDILHPNFTGQVREADADAQILTQIITGKGFTLAKLSNPNAYTATNGVGLNGDATWLDAVRAQVGFSEFMTEHAQVDNYAAPWSLYPDSVLDPSRYDVVAYGVASAGAAGNTYVRLSYPTVNGVGFPFGRILTGDLIWSMGNAVIQTPSSVSINTFNGGGTNYILQVGNLGAIAPVLYDGQPVVVARQHSYVIKDVPKYQDTQTWTYRHRIYIGTGNSGTNFIRLTFADLPSGFNSWPSAITTADFVDLPCGETSLSGAAFSNSAGSVQVNMTGSFAACAGQSGWLFGTHAMESYNAKSMTTAIAVSGTVPTLTTGTCSGSAAVGGATAGSFTAPTCAAGTIILSGLPTQTNGYACDAWDQATPANTLKQTASTTTSATFTATTTTGDSVVYKCIGF